MKKASIIVILVLLLPLYSYTVIPQAVDTSILPSITSGIGEIITANIGPIVPAIVAPGDSYTIKLRKEFSSLNINSAYMWTVKPEGNSLTVYNYTLSTTSIEPGLYSIAIPPEAREGLYDLVLIADTGEYVVPRSIWVVKSWPSTLRFIENTDLHFITGQPDSFTGDINRFAALTIDNLLSPFFVLWLGDQADNAATNEYMMISAYRYSYTYNIPILGIAGNHDYTAGGTPYTKYLGPTEWYRVIAGKLLIIGLWSLEQGYPSWESLVFAEKVLQEYKSIPYKMILVHHPPFYYQGELYTWYNDTEVLKPYVPGGPFTPVSSYWSGNMTALRYFLKLLEDYNVTMVLSGHTHRDFFTKYVSTRTNTTTLLLTFTTSAHGSASYDGLSLMEFNLETGQLEFPLKPPTFTGFKNSTRALALNSIPIGIYPVKNSLGWSNLTFTFMNVIYSKGAYVFRLENNNLSWINFTGLLLWSLPWNGSTIGFKKLSESNGASIKVLDYKIIAGRLFILLDLNLPFKGSVSFAIYSMVDQNPPEVALRRIIPEKPKVNKTTTIYVDIRDDSWGLNPYTLKVRLGDTVVTYSTTPMDNTYTMTPSTYTEQFNSVSLIVSVKATSNTTLTLPLIVEVSDNAGNTASYSFNITFEAPVTPTPSPTSTPTTTLLPSPTVTTTITPTTTLTPTPTPPTTETTTSPQTVESPAPSPTPTQTTMSSPSPSPTSTPVESKPETPSQGIGITQEMIIAVALLLAVVAVVLALWRAR